MTNVDDSRESSPSSGRNAPAHSGLWLRQRREELGLSLQQVARQLHMSPSAVVALETHQAEQLPPPVFVRGFLRNYARMLGLPETEVVAGYPVAQPVPVPKPSEPLAAGDLREPRSSSVGPALAALGLLAALGFGTLKFYEHLKPEPEPEPAAAAGVAAPAVASEPPVATASVPAAETPGAPATPAAPAMANPTAVAALPAATAGAPAQPAPPPATLAPAATPESVADTLVLHFTGESWVSVVDAEGTRLLYEAGKPGSTRSISGKPPLKVTLGRPGNVNLEFNGQPVPLKTTRNGAPIQLKVGNEG
jgi:cytoskeleton protein RodZ